MTTLLSLSPSRGRLFKIFTDLGPYFRKLESTENNFFFDCLEVCIDAEKEPEQREFFGWWLIVTRSEDGFVYERFNGRYNLEGKWVACKIKKKDQLVLDASFELFFDRLKSLIDTEAGFCLTSAEAVLAEV
ncbi:hypothetical protein GCM10007916_04500 [Psychromonas marina]|uniref:Sigma factor-binding protein Crl n=1 Tax=Psychromonas marina TaxID=88364 RepID=A0ABQ6DX10_9GAMM|nr:sigma factor-binding protein Crl [Psychromonas marina]GLS89383.1 hypothetical protein GCM10007916_04500 [Psychromonas marina]